MIFTEVVFIKPSKKNSEASKVSETEPTEVYTTKIQVIESSTTDNQIIQEHTNEQNEEVENITKATTEENIVEKKSTNLMDLEMISGNVNIHDRVEINTGEHVDAIGMTLTADIGAGETLKAHSSPVYAVYKEYRYFSCKLALLNDNSKNSPLDCFIMIYGDYEEEPFYISPSVSAGSLPVEISNVDISVYNKITIKYAVHNPLDYDWQTTMWSLDFYQISWVIFDANLSN